MNFQFGLFDRAVISLLMPEFLIILCKLSLSYEWKSQSL